MEDPLGRCPNGRAPSAQPGDGAARGGLQWVKPGAGGRRLFVDRLAFVVLLGLHALVDLFAVDLQVLFGVSQQLLVLAFLVTLIGASNNLWHPPAIAYLPEMYPDNRGYALSIHALGANLGDTLAPLAAGSLLAALTWQGTAVTGAVPVVLVALLIAVLLRKGSSPHIAQLGVVQILGPLTIHWLTACNVQT